MLELRNISKHFGSTAALSDVSLAVRPGEIHGLLGENGAGKSTLMNVLFGLLQPDGGTISLHERLVKINSPRVAQALGIGMVHQHFKLVPTLTTLQNLALATHQATRTIRPLAMQLAEQLRWNLPLDTRIEKLSVGQQQRIEIIKALLAIGSMAGAAEAGRRTRMLILDEPTAVLTPSETSELFTALETLVRSENAAGTAIIFISHKLAEVEKICDTVTILRRGRHVITAAANELTARQMTEHMVGAPIELPRKGGGTVFPREPAPTPLLELKNVSSGQLKNASLALLPGTITGIAGVDGNGQSDLANAIVGSQPLAAGTLTILGQDAGDLSIRERLEHLACIPEDRHLQALVLPMTIQQNLLLKDYRRPPYSSAGWLNFGSWRRHAVDLIERFDIRTNSSTDPASRLSGGNQQKIVLARELHNPGKKIVLALNPTRGLDVGATAFVMNQLLKARDHGAAVLLIHSDLDELLALADDVHVLYNGTLTHAAAATKESIAPLMLGVSPSSS
jgi:simple sugar transport system ATP-binding protein